MTTRNPLHTVLYWLGWPFRLLLIGVIRGYQRFISPLFPPSCRLYPCCSQYGLEAIRTHGAAKGTLLTGARIVRCNPWTKGGINPVPPPGRWRSAVTLDGTARPPARDDQRIDGAAHQPASDEPAPLDRAGD